MVVSVHKWSFFPISLSDRDPDFAFVFYCGAGLALGVDLIRPFSAETFLPVSLVILVAPSFVATIATMRYVRWLGNRGK
jgi:hypothetical protein